MKRLVLIGIATISFATSVEAQLLWCNKPTPTITSVGVTSTVVPASALANRNSITVCNSLENSGSPLIKCTSDGSTPVMGKTNAGDVLAKGDCATYYPAAAAINCISDTAATGVHALECK